MSEFNEMKILFKLIEFKNDENAPGFYVLRKKKVSLKRHQSEHRRKK